MDADRAGDGSPVLIDLVHGGHDHAGGAELGSACPSASGDDSFGRGTGNRAASGLTRFQKLADRAREDELSSARLRWNERPRGTSATMSPEPTEGNDTDRNSPYRSGSDVGRFLRILSSTPAAALRLE
jgi:hypothetical protein